MTSEPPTNDPAGIAALSQQAPVVMNGHSAAPIPSIAPTERAAPVASPSPFILVSWEGAFYLGLIVIALVMRLWDLGPRAYHHDESLHAYYSYTLYNGGGFQHNPLLHGPFLFLLTALGFFVFGDNLVAPRIFPAIFGSVLVLMPLLFRPYLGRWGAVAAALMLAFSPSMLYFSRFVRNDIWTLVFDLGLIYSMWRYIEAHRIRFIFLGALFLCLHISAKETGYITAVVLGSFLAVLWSQRFLTPKLDGQTPSKGLRQRVGRLFNRIPPTGGFLILMTTLCLPLGSAVIGFVIQQFFPSLVLVNPAESWPRGPVGAPIGGMGPHIVAGAIAGVLFAISAVFGWAWKKTVWLGAFALFYGVYFFLHTTFFTNMVGMGSGVWQGLGYWIAQQSVERGSQPWYYYFILLPLYDTIPFFAAIIAIGVTFAKMGRDFLWRGGAVVLFAVLLVWSIYTLNGTKMLYAPLALALPILLWFALRYRGNPFDWFLVYWAAMTMLIYVIAGEKMPWLVVHLALPLIFLAARLFGRMLEGIVWSEAIRRGGLVALVLVPAFALVFRAMLISSNWQLSPVRFLAFAGPVLFAAFLIGLASWLWGRIGTRTFLAFSVVGLVALVSVFTVRSGVQAAYVNGDVPKEMLVYTQTSPQIAQLVRDIDRLAIETGKGTDLKIYIDTSDGFGWPWFWYLRQYKQATFEEVGNRTTPINADIVVMNAGNAFRLTNRDDYREGKTIPFRQWFPEESYRGYTVKKFFGDIRSSASWNRMLNFYTYRTLGTPLGHIDSVVYYSKTLPQ